MFRENGFHYDAGKPAVTPALVQFRLGPDEVPSRKSMPVERTNIARGDAVAKGDTPARSAASAAQESVVAGRFAQAREPRLLPEAYFLEHVRREHLRAVRSNSHVAVAILSFEPETKTEPIQLFELSKMLQILVRETDVLGWYGKNAIAVLLTDTNDRGAEECIRRILARTEHLAVRCEIRASGDLAKSVAQTSGVGASGTPPISSPLAHHDAHHHSRTALAFKRGMDICGAVAGMMLLSPIMLFAAVAVKATSRGPIIFRQIRMGKGGTPFVFYKFRSMRIDTGFDSHRDYVQSFIRGDSSKLNQGDEKRPLYKMKGDPRITTVGNFLRKSSIDELPQLFNVLIGDMSLVGPRPPIPYETEAYSAWHLRRILEVKPGLTGLWQVEGRSIVGFDDMVRLDLQYARNWSIWMDIKILLKTVKVVLQCRGAG